MASAFDIFVAYQLIRVLTTPWEEMPAYKLGIIDNQGNVLRKSTALKTNEEKSSFTIFHRIAFNLKKIIEKLPFGKMRLASFAAGLFLLREHVKERGGNGEILEQKFMRFIQPKLAGNQMDHLFEQQQYNTGIVTAGTYAIEGERITIEHDLKPVGECLGYLVYEYTGKHFTEYDL